MPFDCYQLPGPAAFVDTLENDIRQGKSIVLRLPRWLPRGFGRILRARTNEWYHWITVDQESHRSPAEFRAFIDRNGDGVAMPAGGASGLYEKRGFAGKLYWLDKIPAERWLEWSRFLVTFADESRRRQELARSVFVIQCDASHSETLDEDVLLVARTWDAEVSSSDMLLHAHQLLPATRSRGIRRSLRATLCSELALWDFALCEELTHLGLSCLVQPQSFLVDYARSRDWGDLPSDAPADILWAEGILHAFEGQEELHSAYLALKGNSRGVERRIWQAELKVLFPFVEQQRIRLLEECGHYLRLPHVVENSKTITEMVDLELGHIHNQFSMSYRVPRKLRDFTRLLRDVRNSLAHVEAVKRSDLTKSLFEPDFTGV